MWPVRERKVELPEKVLPKLGRRAGGHYEGRMSQQRKIRSPDSHQAANWGRGHIFCTLTYFLLEAGRVRLEAIEALTRSGRLVIPQVARLGSRHSQGLSSSPTTFGSRVSLQFPCFSLMGTTWLPQLQDHKKEVVE